MIIEIITSELDFYIIEKIRDLRIKAGLDQVALAQKLGVSEGYIGNIENPKHTAKANIRMLARIANALELKSYMELFPEEIMTSDMVRLKIELFDISSRSQNIDENGEVIKRLIELEKTSISIEEIEQLKANKTYKYCTIIEK